MTINSSSNPTPITPPRVPMLDDRTGLITREWYMFFLSLFTATHAVDAADVSPTVASLVATYDDALRALAQSTDTRPPPAADPETAKQLDAAASAPPATVAELQQQIDALRQELWTLRQPEMGAYVAFGGPATLTTLAVSGAVSLTGTGQRVTADFSNATAVNRAAFQTGTTNGNSTAALLPNGTGTVTQWLAANNSDPANCSFVSIFVSSTEARLQSSRLGTGSFLPLKFYTNSAEQGQIDTAGNWRIGTAAIATTATDGFLYIPTCAGTPTGTPTTVTGLAPLVVNSTNNKLYFYSGGAWRDAGP